jgi:hypothetical protein
LITQLRDVLAAVQSAEVAQEDEHDGLLAPQVAEAYGYPRGAGKRDVGQGSKFHGGAV